MNSWYAGIEKLINGFQRNPISFTKSMREFAEWVWKHLNFLKIKFLKNLLWTIYCVVISTIKYSFWINCNDLKT